MKMNNKIIVLAALLAACLPLNAQKYKGVVDKSIAVVGGETILLSDVEAEVQQQRAVGSSSDRDLRCEILESMMEGKLFLMQARLDSLTVGMDMVENSLSQRIDYMRTSLGGDEEMEKYFGIMRKKRYFCLYETFREYTFRPCLFVIGPPGPDIGPAFRHNPSYSRTPKRLHLGHLCQGRQRQGAGEP